MLKITTQTDALGTVFELEGKLAGLWVQELKSCWQQVGVAGQRVRVVLKAVSFIDGPGRALLAEMYRNGVELTGEGCMTKAIIEKIGREE
jgi:hypothetical protein